MIRKADISDLNILTGLALKLWPDHDRAELEAHLAQIISSPEAAFFLAVEESRTAGFAQCQLRRDYVEGTETSPVGYLEGIFIEETFRRRGLAKQLLSACESWAGEQGCREFASDCELTNGESLFFYLALGFEEANRIICFTKKIGEGTP